MLYKNTGVGGREYESTKELSIHAKRCPASHMTLLSRAKKKTSTKAAVRSASAAGWAARTLRGMTLREKIGQLLMVPFFGEFLAEESPEYEALLHEIRDNHVGGMMLATVRTPSGLKRSHVGATVELSNRLQTHAKIPLLFSADFENGTRMRLEEGTSFPSPMAIAAARDPRLAYALGKAVATEARAAGIHWIFAPDADVNNNPANPIINVRSFGENPQEVSRYVAEYVRGIEDNGCIATAKHFPGHGNVDIDSHLALPLLNATRAQLNTTELPPFRAAIAAGVGSIMTGHLQVQAIDVAEHTPATFSHKTLTELLRKEMKFRGVIVTDGMDMGGVTTLCEPGEAAVRAVEAGADVILISPNPDAALAALERAVRASRISEARIDESAKRILIAKARVGLHRDRLVDIARLPKLFALQSIRSQALTIAERGVTLLRNATNVLPLDATRPQRVLLVAISADPDSMPGETLEPELRKEFACLQVLRADTRFCPVSGVALPPSATYDVAVAALFVRVADRKGSVALPDDQHSFIKQLIAAGKPVIVASFGSPYLIERFHHAQTWLACFSTNEVAQRAVAHAITGRSAVAGKIPVTVPGIIERGAGLHLAANPMVLRSATTSFAARMRPVATLLNRAVKDDIFPGGVLAVGLRGELAVLPFGRLSQSTKGAPVVADTIYDVASLTKPIVTATLAMMLVEGKLLDLDAAVDHYLPGWAAATSNDAERSRRERVTVRMLLLHASGLPAHRDFFLTAKDRRALLGMAAAEPLLQDPGIRTEYSDLGFILLAEIIEQISGRGLDELACDYIFSKLGMTDSTFNPPKKLRPRIAPTENDVSFRKRLLRGEVHDENAWVLGGVAGHAGLFSTAHDLAVFAQMLLNGGIYAHERLLSRATIETFTARVAGGSARALGWDVPTMPGMTGQYFSPGSYGHWGFTGTSLWIDPEKDLFVVLLTNRVHPTRANDKIRQLRPAIHDAIFETLGLAGISASR